MSKEIRQYKETIIDILNKIEAGEENIDGRCHYAR